MLDISTWSRNIDNFSGQLKQWSKEAFGCLWRMKASLKEKLDRIDAKRGSSVNTYINLEYKRIWRKYKQVLAEMRRRSIDIKNPGQSGFCWGS